jgi:hypothetical protein
MRLQVPVTILSVAFTVHASWWNIALFNDLQCYATNRYTNSGKGPTAQCQRAPSGVTLLSIIFGSSNDLAETLCGDNNYTDNSTIIGSTRECVSIIWPTNVNQSPWWDKINSFTVVEQPVTTLGALK